MYYIADLGKFQGYFKIPSRHERCHYRQQLRDMRLKVSARFVGSLRQVIGEERHIFHLNKGTVKELLDSISEEYPKAEENLKQAGAFIAGRIVRKAEFDTPLLKEGDEVSLILPVAGG